MFALPVGQADIFSHALHFLLPTAFQFESCRASSGPLSPPLRLANLGPDSADLLLRRMAALDLDRNEVSRTEPRTFQDLQRVCTMCNHHRRCRGDLARDADDPAWHDYCPNAATLMALDALPWRARSEW
jgi:Family of unknown function (DUF6455)